VVGSGDVDLADIGGNVHVRSHGSGDIRWTAYAAA
jgi:hypothetical protein